MTLPQGFDHLLLLGSFEGALQCNAKKLSGKSFLAFCKGGLEHGDANHVLRRPRQDFHILG
jgi:hypothetical protein